MLSVIAEQFNPVGYIIQAGCVVMFCWSAWYLWREWKRGGE